MQLGINLAETAFSVSHGKCLLSPQREQEEWTTLLHKVVGKQECCSITTHNTQAVRSGCLSGNYAKWISRLEIYKKMSYTLFL